MVGTDHSGKKYVLTLVSGSTNYPEFSLTGAKVLSVVAPEDGQDTFTVEVQLSNEDLGQFTELDEINEQVLVDNAESWFPQGAEVNNFTNVDPQSGTLFMTFKPQDLQLGNSFGQLLAHTDLEEGQKINAFVEFRGMWLSNNRAACSMVLTEAEIQLKKKASKHSYRFGLQRENSAPVAMRRAGGQPDPSPPAPQRQAAPPPKAAPTSHRLPSVQRVSAPGQNGHQAPAPTPPMVRSTTWSTWDGYD
jgi:hypothetical protein